MTRKGQANRTDTVLVIMSEKGMIWNRLDLYDASLKPDGMFPQMREVL